jgi:hypothetical protein
MKVLPVGDSIWRLAAEYEPWFPEPTPDHHFYDDQDWQRGHLWDSLTEDNDNLGGAYRGPSILHHPDLPYALDNGWRVFGGPKNIDHQERGETGSGSTLLYKIGKDGIIHEASLGMGPDDAHHALDQDEEAGHGLGRYGEVPESNWRHLISQEGGFAEGPHQHDSLRDLVDDEKARTNHPEGLAKGYEDFKLLPGYRNTPATGGDSLWAQKHMHTLRRAWDTGTNDNHQHFDDPMPDPYANIDKIPRNQKPVYADDEPEGEMPSTRHPRYGSDPGPCRE